MTALAPQPPAWWPQGIPYVGMPSQIPYDMLRAVRAVWPASGDTRLINAATNMSDEELLRFLASTNTGSPQWEQAAQQYLSPQPTVDLQRFWNDAYYRQNTLDQANRQQQMEFAKFAAQPQNLAASLMALGRSREDVGGYLQGSPMWQSLTPAGGNSFGTGGSPWTASPMQQQQMSGASAQPAAQTITPLAGRHAPMRQTINDFQSGNQDRLDLITGLASFSGTTPSAYWSDFQQATPRGTTARPTRFV